jgi:uncharacterized protein (DUF2461 family)
LTRLPRGFEALRDSPLAEAVRLKSFIVEQPFAAKVVTSPEFADAVSDFAVRALPLLKFGWAALD